MEQPDEHYSLVGGNLVITNPDKSKHAGKYVCVAKNVYGIVISKEATVRFGCKWRFLFFLIGSLPHKTYLSKLHNDPLCH